MESLTLGEVSLSYVVRGTGPGLLVPWCNVQWPDMPFFEELAERFRLLMVMPRGYGTSSRAERSDDYTVETLGSDLLAVCDAVCLDEFAVLGYSLTAAMAAWLAGVSSRVQAVVAGGFPLLGSYEAVLRGARHDVAEHGEISATQGFDVHAVLAFYDALARMPDGSLVTQSACPIFAFWGSEDDVLARFNTARPFEGALRTHGVKTAILDGCDHVTALLRLGELLDSLTTWLDEAPSRT